MTGVAPSVNQIELHPRFQQKELAAYHTEHGIVTESWSPLGQGTCSENQRSKPWPKSMAERQPKSSFGGISIMVTL
jgi:diketogulonate reductase-like aldo/keto reductase